MSAMRSEDLDARLRELLGEAAEVGRGAEQGAIQSDRKIVARRGSRSERSEQLLRELRDALEDEVVVARSVVGEAVIEEREKQREIAKRALAHLKLPRLRDIAEDLGLPRGGALEDVLDGIVRAYRADEEAIARLVIEYEEEPPPERRFSTRLFFLLEPLADMGRVGKRIELFAGRYMRVGIAKWFVIDDVNRTGDGLAMAGQYRSYRADADRVDEETYRLRAERQGAEARARLCANRAFVEVDARAEAESKAALSAVLHAGALRTRSELPIRSRAPEGPLLTLDSRSIFLLDLLHARFRSSNLEILNLTAAGFKTAGEREASGEEETRPAVRSVRFQGQHLLDSRPACELLVAGQALVDLSFLARMSLGNDQSVLAPITVRLQRQHAAVYTGFGTSPQLAQLLHREVVGGVKQAFETGLKDVSALERLARQIRARAEQDDPVERADLFGPQALSESGGDD